MRWSALALFAMTAAAILGCSGDDPEPWGTGPNETIDSIDVLYEITFPFDTLLLWNVWYWVPRGDSAAREYRVGFPWEKSLWAHPGDSVSLFTGFCPGYECGGVTVKIYTDSVMFDSATTDTNDWYVWIGGRVY
jgi:hypothetical protein